MFILDDIYPIEDGQRTIDHCEIGRYFSHFEGTHYVPNESLEKIYPDDAVVREHWINGFPINSWEGT